MNLFNFLILTSLLFSLSGCDIEALLGADTSDNEDYYCDEAGVLSGYGTGNMVCEDPLSTLRQVRQTEDGKIELEFSKNREDHYSEVSQVEWAGRVSGGIRDSFNTYERLLAEGNCEARLEGDRQIVACSLNFADSWMQKKYSIFSSGESLAYSDALGLSRLTLTNPACGRAYVIEHSNLEQKLQYCSSSYWRQDLFHHGFTFHPFGVKNRIEEADGNSQPMEPILPPENQDS